MLRIYNSLSRNIEEFKPIQPQNVGMYTCGPTVYSFAHIGNFRTYTSADVLLRTLQYNGYDVNYVMNLTDVGHLSGDNLGDADTGEDRMEKSAKKEGKTAWEIAEFYTNAFLQDYNLLNLVKPQLFAKATDHIEEQISLVKKLEEKGYAYKTSDGIYFDTSLFPEYGKISDLDQIKEGARVEVNPEKKNPRDFALWKFSYPNGVGFEEYASSFDKSQDGVVSRRQMEWESPWGLGFPGWHIECSAMSMKYLGNHFDIHAGGMDLRETHHPNEIAQSECATGETFVNYWVHSAFMLVQGEKMSKSKGNIYRVYDLQKDGYDPLALRYLYLQTHYRQEMNFTFPALDAAQNALERLRETVASWGEPRGGVKELEKKFLDAVNDDLNMPEALSVVWELVKSDNTPAAKAATMFKLDAVLGFNLESWKEENAGLSIEQTPPEVRELIEKRQSLRKGRQFTQADHLRNRIRKLGYDVEDTKNGLEIKKIS